MGIVGESRGLSIDRRFVMIILFLVFFLSTLWFARMGLNAPRPSISVGTGIRVEAYWSNDTCLLLSVNNTSGNRIVVDIVRIGNHTFSIGKTLAPHENLSLRLCSVKINGGLGSITYTVNGRKSYRLFMIPVKGGRLNY